MKYHGMQAEILELFVEAGHAPSKPHRGKRGPWDLWRGKTRANLKDLSDEERRRWERMRARESERRRAEKVKAARPPVTRIAPLPRPYECDRCGDGFGTEAGLANHRYKLHGVPYPKGITNVEGHGRAPGSGGQRYRKPNERGGKQPGWGARDTRPISFVPHDSGCDEKMDPGTEG